MTGYTQCGAHTQWNSIPPEQGRKVTHATAWINPETPAQGNEPGTKRQTLTHSHETPRVVTLAETEYNRGEGILGNNLKVQNFSSAR